MAPSSDSLQVISPNKEKDSALVEELIFGRFCGHCGGNCSPMFSLNTSGNVLTLRADYENHYFKGRDSLQFKNTLDEPAKLELAYQVMRRLPEMLLAYSKTEDSFGCPDCADGCGIYVEFIPEGGTAPKKFRLDLQESEGQPKVLSDYARFVSDKVNEIMGKY
ncbi:MAG: hypothetical protein K0Q66_1285 [Chitinophagaceae bacterium]|nr:hypothetical protein [Chitinophagaceae bacterium]